MAGAKGTAGSLPTPNNELHALNRLLPPPAGPPRPRWSPWASWLTSPHLHSLLCPPFPPLQGHPRLARHPGRAGARHVHRRRRRHRGRGAGPPDPGGGLPRHVCHALPPHLGWVFVGVGCDLRCCIALRLSFGFKKARVRAGSLLQLLAAGCWLRFFTDGSLGHTYVQQTDSGAAFSPPVCAPQARGRWPHLSLAPTRH